MVFLYIILGIVLVLMVGTLFSPLCLKIKAEVVNTYFLLTIRVSLFFGIVVIPVRFEYDLFAPKKHKKLKKETEKPRGQVLLLLLYR